MLLEFRAIDYKSFQDELVFSMTSAPACRCILFDRNKKTKGMTIMLREYPELYVAIPQNGKVYLTRGAVFDYYEFISKERLTDEAWQEKIKTDPPQRPPFTKSYMDENYGGEVPRLTGTE